MADRSRRGPQAGRIVRAAALAALAACDPAPAPRDALTIEGAAMGTRYRVTVPEPLPAAADEISLAVRAALERVDALMSTYREDSELSALNRHAANRAMRMSPETFHVLAAAREISEATSGAFDITVGPLVDAWGFGPSGQGEPPSSEAVERLRLNSGWRKLVLDARERTVRKAAPGVRSDLSAIAKGYAVDQVSRRLQELGCEDHLVDVGGEMRIAGSNPAGERWRIGIERPDAAGRVVHRIVALSDTGVATSGDYRNFRDDDGTKRSHVLDPRSGRPVATGVASATVLDPSAMRADAFATALLVLGERDGIELAEREGLAVLLLVRDGASGFRESASSRFRARIRY